MVKKWELRMHDAAALFGKMRASGPTIPSKETSVYHKLHPPNSSPSLFPCQLLSSESPISSSSKPIPSLSQTNNDIGLDVINNYDMDTSPMDEPLNSPYSPPSSPAPFSPLCNEFGPPAGDHEFDEISDNFSFSGFGQPSIESGDGPGSTHIFNIEMQDEPMLSRPTTPPNHDADPSIHTTPQCQNIGSPPGEPELVFEAPEPATDVLKSSSRHWFWQIILLLTTYLHLHFHLPHRACILMLKVLRLVFIGSHLIQADNRVPVTLTTTFNRLNLHDTFKIHPVCPNCRRTFPSGDSAPSQCTFCMAALFETQGDEPVAETSTTSRLKKLKIRCPQRPLSSCLPAFLNCPGIEETLDEWRTYETEAGKLKTVMDGNVWKTLAGHDKKPFFDNSPERSDPDELRIGITLGFDG